MQPHSWAHRDLPLDFTRLVQQPVNALAGACSDDWALHSQQVGRVATNRGAIEKKARLRTERW